ncbi:MAG: polymer-forming cytoskeletal protein [bacterium]|nr:polymer-forming cytoskeletal protein [bacterium]
MLFSIVFFAVLAPFVADVITPDIYLLEAGEIQDEDAYIAATSARIDGRVEGDVFIASGAISIGGVVTGDVLVLSHGRLEITGTVEGSVRALAREVVVEGSIGGDLAVVTGAVDVSGDVARDVLLFAGSTSFEGTAGRDIRGRFLDGMIDGTIGRDVDVSVRTLSVGPGADVIGDLLYRADGDASISGGAKVAGQFQQLPSRSTFVVRVWLIAATILSFFAFVVSGFVLFLMFRATMSRAAGLVRTQPWRTLWVGFVAIFALPLLSVVFVFTVVGAPVGVLLLILWLLGLVFAPLPAVAAGGDLILGGRGGLFGAFVVGAAVWRLGIWLIPVVGVLLYTTALMAGTGGLVLAAWRQRQAGIAEAQALGPPTLQADKADIPADWEPPLAPSAVGLQGVADDDTELDSEPLGE